MYPASNAATHAPAQPKSQNMAERLMQARGHLGEALTRLRNTTEGLCGKLPPPDGNDVATNDGFLGIVDTSIADLHRAAEFIQNHCNAIESRLG